MQRNQNDVKPNVDQSRQRCKDESEPCLSSYINSCCENDVDSIEHSRGSNDRDNRRCRMIHGWKEYIEYNCGYERESKSSKEQDTAKPAKYKLKDIRCILFFRDTIHHRGPCQWKWRNDYRRQGPT